MAEYCLDCWNRMNGTNDPAKKYILSKEKELCEGCEQQKHVIIMPRRFSPFSYLFAVIYTICCKIHYRFFRLKNKHKKTRP